VKIVKTKKVLVGMEKKYKGKKVRRKAGYTNFCSTSANNGT
jgi:hypothetical protein